MARQVANSMPESSSSSMLESSSSFVLDSSSIDNLEYLTHPEYDLKGMREGLTDDYWRFIPLVKAAFRGDWDTAKNIFDQDGSAINAPINCFSETALFIAVRAGERAIHFVKELVKLMSKDDLKKLRDMDHNTALHTAAMVGNKRAAVILVGKNPDLLYIYGDESGHLPMHVAAENACKDTLVYLLEATSKAHVPNPFSDANVVLLVNYAIKSGFYDVAHKLLKLYPQAVKSPPKGHEFALQWIATKASAFPSGNRLNCWQQLLYDYAPAKLDTNSIEDSIRDDLESPANEGIVQKCDQSMWAQRLKEFSNYGSQKLKSMLWKVFEFLVPFIKLKHIRVQKLMHIEAVALLKFICKEMRSLNDSYTSRPSAYDVAYKAANTALGLGIHEVIEEIADSFPYIIWMRDANNRSLFQRAVIDRQENVFKLLYQLGDYKRYAALVKDNDGNTMLHLSARLAPQKKLDLDSGAALQMQHELQWFKEVEKLVMPRHKYWRNKDKKTPAMIFTEEHKELVVKGQEWMKNTASSCTLVASLIVTAVFAAGITVPGGNNNNSGLPIYFSDTIFSEKIAFIAFAVSDAISLFMSTTSLLMFLSILTSRYAESDFLYVLPRRLIIGLIALFLSITSMIVAFSATLYLTFGHHTGWILIPVVILASLPVTSFLSLQFPLLVVLISSTYGHGLLGKQSDRLIC